MRTLFRILTVLLLPIAALAQDANTRTREGNDLAAQKNYTAAIDKYKAALAINADHAPANYQMAFALNATGKGMDGIPYLQKVFASTNASANLISGAYELSGAIYDQNHQPQKAIESYQAGIKANPASQSLHYNLGLAYFRNHQYAEAETAAIDAINIDPKYAGSMRLYALVCFHQNKRAAALLGFCRFITLEPNTARSAEAYGNIQHILQGGALKPEPGEAVSHAISADNNALNQAITQSVKSFANKRYASAADLLAAQLTIIFVSIDKLAEKQTSNDFFRYQADYFYQLAQTPYMPAFARQVSASTPQSAKWMADHTKEMGDLDAWIKANDKGK